MTPEKDGEGGGVAGLPEGKWVEASFQIVDYPLLTYA